MRARPVRATPALGATHVRLPLRTPRLDLVRPSTRWGNQSIRLLNDVSVSRWLLHVPHPYRQSDLAEFLRIVRTGARDDAHLRLWLVERATDRLIGGMGLHGIDPVHRRAELGYWVGRPYWRRGFALEAGRAVVELAFKTLGLHRLEAATFHGNTASQALLRKLGFRYEGYRPETFFVQGRWMDDVLYGRFATPRGARRSPPTKRVARSRTPRPPVASRR